MSKSQIYSSKLSYNVNTPSPTSCILSDQMIPIHYNRVSIWCQNFANIIVTHVFYKISHFSIQILYYFIIKLKVLTISLMESTVFKWLKVVFNDSILIFHLKWIIYKPTRLYSSHVYLWISNFFYLLYRGLKLKHACREKIKLLFWESSHLSSNFDTSQPYINKVNSVWLMFFN